MGPLCDGEPYRFPPTTNVPVSSRLLSKLLKQPRTKDLRVAIERASEHPIKSQVKKLDGKALPIRLDRRSMPFFKPPANALDPHQLELCADAFRRTWFEIAGGRRLPPSQEERLQTEVSAKLCFFAAKGVMDPTVLQGLTVATVKFQPGTGRRLRLLGTPRPVAG